MNDFLLGIAKSRQQQFKKVDSNAARARSCKVRAAPVVVVGNGDDDKDGDDDGDDDKDGDDRFSSDDGRKSRETRRHARSTR